MNLSGLQPFPALCDAGVGSGWLASQLGHCQSPDCVLPNAGNILEVDTRAWPWLQELLIDCKLSALSLSMNPSHAITQLAVRAGNLCLLNSKVADLADMRRVRVMDVRWLSSFEHADALQQAAGLRWTEVLESPGRGACAKGPRCVG